MSSTTATAAPAPAKTEWLVVVPDYPDVLAKRLEVRSKHFAGIAARRDAGTWKFGGATLAAPAGPDATAADLAFTGSTLIVVAASRAEVVAQLAGDVYAVEGVWDVEKAQIWPIKTAFRNA